MTTILIVDDHPLVRTALSQQVTYLLPSANVLFSSDAESAARIVTQTPDLGLILLDFKLHNGNVLSLLKTWTAEKRNVPVIVVSGMCETEVEPLVLAAGAAAFVAKTASEDCLRQAIARVLTLAEDGTVAPAAVLNLLTNRQQAVLRALLAGMSNLDIANHLQISELTVKTHLTAIFKVLSVVSRTQAVLLARAAGW